MIKTRIRAACCFPWRRISKHAFAAASLALSAAASAGADAIGSVQVYMQPEEGRTHLFPSAVHFESVVHHLSTQAKGDLVKALGRSFAEDSLRVDTAYGEDGALLGYAVVSEEIGKFRPITFIVGIEPHFAVRGAAILIYRESRGGQVRQPRFLRQYVGKDSRDPIRINRDIVNISGATLSVRALNFGVRKVLALTEHFYGAAQSAMH